MHSLTGKVQLITLLNAFNTFACLQKTTTIAVPEP